LRLPRDLSGTELASLLGRYGYQVTRQTGSQLRVTSTFKGAEHHVTIPGHKALRLGTLNAILTDVAGYLEVDRAVLAAEIFRR
jgi:predicted RNA binding protein YcfA (HicA-like mRNA interferase family)